MQFISFYHVLYTHSFCFSLKTDMEYGADGCQNTVTYQRCLVQTALVVSECHGESSWEQSQPILLLFQIASAKQLWKWCIIEWEISDLRVIQSENMATNAYVCDWCENLYRGYTFCQFMTMRFCAHYATSGWKLKGPFRFIITFCCISVNCDY